MPTELNSAVVSQNPEILNSWKEISTYIGRGIRTVQRWERDLQLPIHRPRHKSRSAVMAFRGELDKWLVAVAADVPALDVDSSIALRQLKLRLRSVEIERRTIKEKIRNIQQRDTLTIAA